VDDLAAKTGAPNIDSTSTGTTLRDYLRASDFVRLSEDLAAMYMIAPQNRRSYPSIEEQATYYDSWNACYRLEGFEEIEHESQARGKKVLQMLQSLPLTHPTILEVGCGTGWFTEVLCGVGKVTAVDLSPKAIEVAKQRGMDAHLISGDFCQMDLPPRYFDAAICIETIAYIPDQEHFIGKLASSIKPGGYLILTSVNTFVYLRRSNIRPPEPGQVRKWLSRRELLSLLRSEFRIVKHVTVLPKGDQGILRVVNSHKVNRVLNRIFSEKAVTWAKEKLGLGHCRVVLAERRDP
jgi:2-polyprenyl-3-methyl-5-hydroxy-6-metoxy-1,4-benzoquinol methylase